jgi:primosomal protein N'
LERAKKWKKETCFMQKEASFFSKIILKSHALAHGAKKEQLDLLQSQLFHFRDNDLAACHNALEFHEVQLAEESNCKYPPSSFGITYDSHQDLEMKLEELDAVLKGLKLKAFEAIGEFLTVRIF